MVSNDPNDIGALTLNHLILLKGAPTSMPVEIKSNGWIRKRKQVHLIVESFCKRWIKEYLPELRRKSKWHKECIELKLGDLVLLVEKNKMLIPFLNFHSSCYIDAKIKIWYFNSAQFEKQFFKIGISSGRFYYNSSHRRGIYLSDIVNFSALMLHEIPVILGLLLKEDAPL